MKFSTTGVGWLAVGCLLLSACVSNRAMVSEPEMRDASNRTSTASSRSAFITRIDQRALMEGIMVIWVNPPPGSASAEDGD